MITLEPTQQLVDDLFWEEIERARAMSPAEKLRAGAELFEYACRITLAGIRHQHPEASEEELRRILEARLELAERLEES